MRHQMVYGGIVNDAGTLRSANDIWELDLADISLASAAWLPRTTAVRDGSDALNACTLLASWLTT